MRIPTRWSFRSSEVAENFDSHVRQQLPWYDLATDVVAAVVSHYVPEGGLVYDIGASTGNITRKLMDELRPVGPKIVPIESAGEMLRQWSVPGVVPVCEDASSYAYSPFDAAVLFLVLQFIPVDRRGELIRRMVESAKSGGVIVIVDKMVPSSGYAATVTRNITLRQKVRNGVSDSELFQKELSLIGVQRPLSPSELPEQAIEVFRFGDFAGFVIEKW